MSNLIDFDHDMYAMPGDFACSRCGNPLYGPVHVISEEDDDEGYEWRTFCPRCWSQIDTDDSTLTLMDIYKSYDAAPYIGEDDWQE